MNSPDKIVTLSQIAENVNSENLKTDVLVFESSFEPSESRKFPTSIDALTISLITEGSGRIGIDLKEYEIKKNSLVVIQPKNYITLISGTETCKAHIIACNSHVIEDILPKLTEILPLLIHHRTEPVNQLSEHDAATLDGYYHFIRRQLAETPGSFTRQKILCLLQSALYEMMDINTRTSNGPARERTRKEEIMAKFIIEVGEHFRVERQVNFYAERLCISSKHLSSVVKNVSGMTAGEWIDNYVVMEAKVLLKTTDRTIQQIADDLNFKNQSFFGKYFKHLTGQTPTRYRRENN